MHMHKIKNNVQLSASVELEMELDEVTAADGSPSEEPPGYDTLTAECRDVGSEVPTLPYASPTAAMPKGSLIAKAPPSYRDIFGEEEKAEQTRSKPSDRVRQSRHPHTQPRRQRENANTHHSPAHSSIAEDTSTISTCLCPKAKSKILVASAALVVLALPLSMLVIGVVNLGVCSSHDIPLYLIIGGCCLSVEILIHTLTILTSMSTDNEKINRSLRICDCFAFFILIWIMIGSNWVFRVSVNSRSCSELDNDYHYADGNSTTTEIATTSSPCHDCSNIVYQFAIGIVVVQYIAVFAVFVFCCCFAIRKSVN